MNFLRRGDVAVMRARLESPRPNYATSSLSAGSIRDPRERQRRSHGDSGRRPCGLAPHDLRDFPDTRAVIPRIVERASRLLYETHEVRAPLVHGGVDGREGFLRFRRPPALPRSLGGDARDGVHCDPDYRKSEARL